MATTPNYGWVTPAPTDFVTDLPADFETFADAVDADLAGLLGGTTGQVLTKDSNADHDFSWQATAGSGKTWTLLGSAALTGAQTITVTGISDKDDILVIVSGASSVSVGSEIRLRINTDTGNNYDFYNTLDYYASTYSNTNYAAETNENTSGVLLAAMSNNAASVVHGGALISGCKNSSGDMVGNFITRATAGGGNNFKGLAGYFIYEGSAALTSVSLFSDTGNFDAGTLIVWGA